MMKDIKIFLANLSHHPGIYQMLGENGEVLYVGKAKNLKKRVASYFGTKLQDPKTLVLINQIKDVSVTVTQSETEAVLLECNLIKKHRPRYNILLRDDKSYPYILISNHTYPRIDIYRGARKKDGKYFGPYPSAGIVRETINLAQKLFLIRTCRDSYFAARTRPCLLYQIKRCSGPCVELIDKADYKKNVELLTLFLQGKNDQLIKELQTRMESAAAALNYEQAVEYRNQITRVRQLQNKQFVTLRKGNADAIGVAISNNICCIQLLSIRQGQVLDSRSYFLKIPEYSKQQEIISAFLSQHYFSHPSHMESIPSNILIDCKLEESDLLHKALSEHAKYQVTITNPSRGKKKEWVSMATNSAKQALQTHFVNKSNMASRFLALQKELMLDELPTMIECFDISHSMGEATVASSVVFDKEGPVKSAYRRYNIAGITKGDDVAAMRQVLTRRFKKLQNEGLMPDMVIIDGGKTQLSVADSVLQEFGIKNVLLIGVSKGPGRKPGLETLHRLNYPPIHLPPDSFALLLIQQIRDEAHRFAITGHRNQRDKLRRRSSLEDVPGVGAKRRRELLRYFGGIQGISRASLIELMKVEGISRSLAERIFAAFHDKTL